MRTIKLVAFFLVFSLFSTSFLNASNSPTEVRKSSKVYQELKTEISSLIQNPKLKENGISSETVKVKFKLNDQNEIENLTINTENNYLKKFIQSSLENKNVALENILSGQFFEVDFIFELK